MKDTKRALRRQQRQRMIARARIIGAFRFGLRPLDPEALEWARRNHNHLACCACRMCNRRRFWWGPPAQEVRENLRAMVEDDPMAFEPEDDLEGTKEGEPLA